MNSLLNVRTAGAKGDGRTDDTGAFQKVLDLAAQSQATVEVPPGTYCVGQLKMHSNTGITGYPAYAWKGNGGSVLKLIDPSAKCLLDLTLALGARVNGLCLDGQHLGHNIHGILVDKPDYGTTEDSPLIEGCKVSRFSGDGVRLSRIWCFRVRGNMFSENLGHGLSVRGWDGFVLDNWLSFNGGAGYASLEENNAVTITGNRIEWNKLGGLRILNGSHYNITGNYIDRSSPGILFAATPGHPGVDGRIVGRVGYTSITGNMIYRSGRPLWDRPGEDCSAHIVLIGSRGVTVTGNTMVAGLDDENNEGGMGFSTEEHWSPRYGVVLEGLRNVVLKDNAMDSCALQELILDRGGHGHGVLIKDNPGELFQKPE